MNDLEVINEKIFEDIKHVDENGYEYWLARELQKVLDYKEWRKFKGVIDKAIIACINSNVELLDHFVGAAKMVQTGDSWREVEDYKLSRYACYLIAQNGDAKKKSIALAQTYFAVQTRKIEISRKRVLSFNRRRKKTM